MKEDLISIIVPVYKVENYIKQCLESICNQSYKNLEIILVDDGSPDNCGKICDEYAKKDNRIKVIHKENGGLSSARNAGLDVATGEYISFIDSDDKVDSKFIECLYNLCMQYTVDIAECDFLKFEDKIEIIENESKIDLLTSIDMQKRMYSKYNVRTIVVWNKLYKRYLYEKIRFPLGKINEDEFITYKVLYNCKSKIATINLPLYYYRYNEKSIMGRKFNLKRFDALDALEERKKFYKEKNLYSLYIKTIERYGNILSDYFELTKYNIEKNDEYLKMLLDRARENYNEIKNIKEISIKFKLKTLLFIISPNLYENVLKKYVSLKKENLNTIKVLFKKFIYQFKYKKYKKTCLKNNQKEFLIFNTPLHGNLGDHAIILAEYELLKKSNIVPFEIPTYDENYCFDFIKSNISKDTIISITGGGFIGSQWITEMNLVNKVIENFSNHKIIIFPQTIYFKENEEGKRMLEKSIKIFNKAENINIYTREKISYELTKKIYKNAKTFLVPDIVLLLDDYQKNIKRTDVMLCMRKDPEGIVSVKDNDYIENIIKKQGLVFKKNDTVINHRVKLKNREKEIKKKLKEFSKARIVITDRLHGMIFAAITNTPCIVFSNYNYKIKGVFEWLKNYKYIVFINNIEGLEENINILLNDDNKYYYEKKYEEFRLLVENLEGDC